MADNLFEPEVMRGLKRLADWGRRDRSLAIECKRVMTPYLPFDKVREHQIEGLLNFTKRPLPKKLSVPAAYGKSRFQVRQEFDFVLIPPGNAFLLVNFRFTKKSPRKDLPTGLNRAFAITPQQYIAVRAELQAQGRASIPIEWFVENAIELERVRFRREDGVLEYGWNLIPLLS